ncbi:MAG: Radical domain protein, partial [Candidatus Krumholzibacteriota bacterium]|nr:Radical domain protein [Candidatus Krumholzibacteriota bacterium]
EPFLYYGTLVRAVEMAAERGFQVGVVTNAYWATDEDDAVQCLIPFKGLVHDLTISSDLFHSDETLSAQARVAREAAKRLGIEAGVITICDPRTVGVRSVEGQIPAGESGVMYKGRAVETLSSRAVKRSWEEFTECPHEDLRDPGRVHIDPLGNVHICQGLVIGNVFQAPLTTICKDYDPATHPIIGPLLKGGPAELVRRYAVPHEEAYADACHLCYEVRRALRGRFPDMLAPDQMYGVMDQGKSTGDGKKQDEGRGANDDPAGEGCR